MRLLKEDREHGFIAIPSSCPSRFANRIAECRAALLEGRSIPAPSREYRAAAERAMAVEKRLFPTKRENPRVETQPPTNIEKLRRQLDAVRLF